MGGGGARGGRLLSVALGRGGRDAKVVLPDQIRRRPAGPDWLHEVKYEKSVYCLLGSMQLSDKVNAAAN
jgi:hypothetical protein